MEKKLNTILALTLIVLTFLPVSNLFSQTSFRDSIIAELNKNVPDTVHVRLLLDLGEYMEYKYPDSAMYYYDEVFEFIKEKQATEDMQALKARTYIYKGNLFKVQGNFDKALECFKNAQDINLELAKSVDKNSIELHEKGVAKSIEWQGMTFDDMGNYDEAEKMYMNAMKIYEQYADTESLASLYSNLGIIFKERGNFATSLQYYKKSHDLYKKLNNPAGIARSNNNIALVYRNIGDYNKALEYFYENIAIFETMALDEKTQNEGKLKLASTFGNMGIIHYNIKDYENAIKYYAKAQAIFEDYGNKPAVASCLNNIGNVYMDEEKLDEAESYFTKTIQIREEIGDKKGMSSVYNNMGMVYEKKGQLEQAIKYYTSSLLLKKEINHLSGQVTTLNNLAMANLKLKKYNDALDFALTSLELGKKLNMAEDQAITYQTLSKIYEAKSDYNKALSCQKEYQYLNDSLFTVEKNKQIVELETKYETQQKEKEIEDLKKNDEIQKLELAKKSLTIRARTLLIIVLTVTIILIISLFIFIYLRNKQKQKQILQEKLLEERKQRIKSIITAQDQERSRIARDLHDGIGQMLSAASMNWKHFASNKEIIEAGSREKLVELSGTLDSVCEEVRNISHHMMPGALRKSGLSLTIKDLLENTFSNTSINFSYDTFGFDQRIDESKEVSIYRVCQELAANVLKHSGCNKVDVQLYKNNNSIILVVEDNGKGIPVAAEGGMGLKNIISRAEAMNGSFMIEKAPLAGTVATLKIPLFKN